MADHIIQWNCRGFKANFNELKLLAEEFSPTAFCLQETHLKPSDNIHFKGYLSYNSFSMDGDRACGGSSILVKQDILHSPINLNTRFQAVAIRLTLHKTITLCSVYLPPTYNFNRQDLEDLISQLPKPFLLVGDFNSHNPLWGDDRLDDRGRRIEDFVASNFLSLMNDGSYTYLHPGYGTYTAIDLTITDPGLLLDFSWKVSSDLHGSDHFPIIIESVTARNEKREQRWNLQKADWPSYEDRCKKLFLAGDLQTDSIEDFTDILRTIADETIPKSSTSTKHIRNPWMNQECR